MIRRGSVVACLLAFASGCAGPSRGDHYTVAIDPQFTADQTSAIEAALTDWSEHVPVRFDAFIGQQDAADGKIVIRAAPGDGTWAVTYESHEVDGGDIRLDVSQLLGGVLQGAAAHELGHAMGLEHETDSTEPVLMYPSTGPRWSARVTVNDAAQWYRIRGRVAP